MDVLPVDIAEEMKECALSAGKSTTEERFGRKGEADANKVGWNEHAESFTEKSDGLLSPEICADIKTMFWYQAWRTANERKGYRSDAARDIQKVDETFEQIVGRGEMSQKLANHVKDMGWNIAWWCANTKVGYDDDAVRDKAKYEADYSKIHGDINLVAMNFNMDKAKKLEEKPKVIATQSLVNNSSVQQSMEFAFLVTQGTTRSVSHQIAFKYGVKVGFKASFFSLVEGNFEATFEFSHSHTFSESMNKGTTKSYKFTLQVPPNSTYIAKGMVQEADMEVPYELVFDFGGKRKSLYGIWKGVAVSTATYEVDESPNH